jgi:hypothetical protein
MTSQNLRLIFDFDSNSFLSTELEFCCTWYYAIFTGNEQYQYIGFEIRSASMYNTFVSLQMSAVPTIYLYGP